MNKIRRIIENIRHFKLPFRPYTALAAGVTAGVISGRGLLFLPILSAFLIVLLFLKKYGRTALLLGAGCGFISGTVCRISAEHQAAAALRPGIYHGRWQCRDAAATAQRQLSNPAALAGIFTPENSRQSQMVFLTVENPDFRPVYGQECRISGELRYSGQPWFSVERNTLQLHKPSRKQRAYFTVHSAGPLRNSGSLRNKLFLMREKILQRLVSGIAAPETANLAAKLFAGASGGFSAGQREVFLASGTVHIFAISGMHTAIFSALVLWLLTPLPRTLKYPLTALAVIFYVLMTGAGIPAVRAGGILVTWCLLQTCFRYVNNRCLLALCYAAMALISPEMLTDLGAQYSFTITAVLILTAQYLGKRRKVWLQRLELMPPRAELTQQYRIRQQKIWNLISNIAAIASAFAAGCGISLFCRHQLSFGGLLANLPVPLITPLLFIAILAKLLIGNLIPAVDGLLASAIEGLFRLLMTFTSWCADLIPMSLSGHDSVLLVILFYSAIAVFFCGNPRWRRPSILLLAVILFIWALPPLPSSSRIYFYSQDHATPPALCFFDHSSLRRTLVNTGGFAAAALLCRQLEEAGEAEIEIGFSGEEKNCRQGLKMLKNRMHCQPVQPEIQKIHPRGKQDKMEKENGWCWQIGEITVSVLDSREKRTITVRKNGEILSATGIPYSSRPIFREIIIP